MVTSHVYSATAAMIEPNYAAIVDACHRQGITKLLMLVSTTGKLTASPEKYRELKARLEADGLTVGAMIFGIGHPAMTQFYGEDGALLTDAIFYDGGFVNGGGHRENQLLPRGWQYAVNEYGESVFCTACPNEACIDGNVAVIREMAQIFDTIWYDDEYRMDGDQWAGIPHRSTVSCYCDSCLAELSARVGRPVTREAVISDRALHEAWVEQKVGKLTTLWKTLYAEGKAVNPGLKMGLMVRWGGEERDGLDIEQLLPYFDGTPLLRLGEGHFGDEYAVPASQVVEYLAASYHINWFPRKASVLTETTYFRGVPPESVVKKAALGLAAGSSEIAYCPCIAGWVTGQPFIEDEHARLDSWATAFADKTAMYQPIAILRGKTAAGGDVSPAKRPRDRQLFPLFSMAGLYSIVIRQGGWHDDGSQQVVAITGLSAWDVYLSSFAGRQIILDGAALLENAPLNVQLGISDVRQGEDGRVMFTGDLIQDGLLYSKGNVTIVPYVWQDIPEAALPEVLAEIRRVVAPKMASVVVEGDTLVMPVQYRYADHDAIMLTNLSHEPRTIALRLPADRQTLTTLDGEPVTPDMVLAADEIRVLVIK